MKFSQLIARHHNWVRWAHLAALAKSLATFREFAHRAQLAGVQERVTLRWPPAHEETAAPQLVSSIGRAALLEEIYTEEDLEALADALSYVQGGHAEEQTFSLSELWDHWGRQVAEELISAGVDLDGPELGLPGHCVEPPARDESHGQRDSQSRT